MIKSPIAGSCKKGYANEVIKSDSWVALDTDKAPYMFSSEVTIENLSAANASIIELLNTNPVLFSKYGFVIADAVFITKKNKISTNKFTYEYSATLTIYAVDQPTEDVELVIAVEF